MEEKGVSRYVCCTKFCFSLEDLSVKSKRAFDMISPVSTFAGSQEIDLAQNFKK